MLLEPWQGAGHLIRVYVGAYPLLPAIVVDAEQNMSEFERWVARDDRPYYVAEEAIHVPLHLIWKNEASGTQKRPLTCWHQEVEAWALLPLV